MSDEDEKKLEEVAERIALATGKPYSEIMNRIHDTMIKLKHLRPVIKV